LTDVVRDLGRSVQLRADLALPDDHLLERYVRQRDEAAFEALLHRHGPLVFGVCRRLLHDVHDAEDAFQATFLILARKAGSIVPRSMVGNWLYGVAHRVAARARKLAWRRRLREQTATDWTAVPSKEKPEEPELAPLLHAEVARLPDKYRSPVVLCYLEGKTNEEAARQLDWPVGTVKGRLNRAREMLRKRLARKGVALSAGLLAAHTLTALAPAALLQETFRAALSYAAGDAAAGGAASAGALALTKGVLQTMLLNKLKFVAAAVLAVAIVGGVGGLAYLGVAAGQAAKDDKKADKPKEDKDAIQGSWKVVKVQENGKDASDTDNGKTFMSAPLSITGTKIVLEGVFEMNYQLDPTAKPKAIDLDNGGDKSFSCVYSLDGNTLTICAPVMPGDPRPSEVACKEGSNTRMLVLKREAKDK
jgi:RNA polymerase sigma factor (sigma-70 family)